MATLTEVNLLTKVQELFDKYADDSIAMWESIPKIGARNGDRITAMQFAKYNLKRIIEMVGKES
jgi:hypothetical protein